MILHKNISLRNYNSFKVDASANYLIIIESTHDIEKFVTSDIGGILPRLILGGGSNILFTSDFKGVILHSKITGIENIREDNNEVWLKAGSGIVWDDFVKYTVDLNFGGLENLSNIPGCVGAAPVQNIGAYGIEAKESIVSVDTFNLESKTFETFTNSQCRFGYRNSVFKQADYKNHIVTQVTFRLKKNPRPVTSYGTVEEELAKFPDRTIQNVRQAIINIRSSKLPSDNYGSAGSFFKNPLVDSATFELLMEKFEEMPYYSQPGNTYKIPAAWLIEKSGLKGIHRGNVGTYENQPLVIINYGNATGNEIVKFSKLIQSKVFGKFDIMLEPEVCFV
jgi:UDP-N-acetylmuramate dehydrogenase